MTWGNQSDASNCVTRQICATHVASYSESLLYDVASIWEGLEAGNFVHQS